MESPVLENTKVVSKDRTGASLKIDKANFAESEIFYKNTDIFKKALAECHPGLRRSNIIIHFEPDIVVEEENSTGVTEMMGYHYGVRFKNNGVVHTGSDTLIPIAISLQNLSKSEQLVKDSAPYTATFLALHELFEINYWMETRLGDESAEFDSNSPDYNNAMDEKVADDRAIRQMEQFFGKKFRLERRKEEWAILCYPEQGDNNEL